MDPLIELEEQDSCPALLTSNEANELQQLGMELAIEGRDTHEISEDEGWGVDSDQGDARVYHAYQVKPFSHVGHFRLTSDDQRTVYIKPKVNIRNVFALLGVAYRFYLDRSPFRPDLVQYDVEKDKVLEPLVARFSNTVAEILQGGLLQRHVEREENLHVFRGRLVFARHISNNLIRQDRLYCRFAQAEVDIPENQVVLWTLILLQRQAGWSRRLRRILQSHILHFGGVSIRQFLPRQCPAFNYDRLSARYQEAHAWCRLFIDLMSLSDRPGETVFSGYLLDMNELFENFVRAMFEKATKKVTLTTAEKNYHYFDVHKRTRICPDLTLRGVGKKVIAVDAKYKRSRDPSTDKHPDLYQIVAYCTALGLTDQISDFPEGILVYPKSEWAPQLEDRLHVITGRRDRSDLTIQFVWLDLESETLIEDTELRFVEILQRISPQTESASAA